MKMRLAGRFTFSGGLNVDELKKIGIGAVFVVPAALLLFAFPEIMVALLVGAIILAGLIAICWAIGSHWLDP